eukprot:symbB.v1.2.023367.t1/scaffold2129.1/size105239/4
MGENRHPAPDFPDLLADADEHVRCYVRKAQLECQSQLLKLWSDVQDIGFEVASASSQKVPGQPAWQTAVDEVLFLPFRVQLVLALLTAFVVAFCVGFPFAVLGLVLEMELVQHFLRWCYFRGGRWLHFFRALPADQQPHTFRKLVEERGELARKAAETGKLKATQASASTPLAFAEARKATAAFGPALATPETDTHALVVMAFAALVLLTSRWPQAKWQTFAWHSSDMDMSKTLHSKGQQHQRWKSQMTKTTTPVVELKLRPSRSKADRGSIQRGGWLCQRIHRRPGNPVKWKFGSQIAA